MLTTKNLLTRLTFSAGLGVAVIAGGAVAVAAAPVDPDDAVTTRPTFDYHLEDGVVVAERPTEDIERGYPYPHVDLSEYFGSDLADDDSDSDGSDDPKPRVIPGLDPDLDLDRFEIPGRTVPIPDDVITPEFDPCVLPGLCPSGDGDVPDETPDETPEETPDETTDETADETPGETPEDTPDETPDETPEETPEDAPDTEPVVPKSEGSLAFTGAGSLVLAGIGTAVAGVGFAAHRLSKRMKR